ncbi:MAG TPA: hypothetical protein VGX00_06465 [Thermoplasmata archaeon]|nr:hypothetical protein [Thermoplasmata archaeon]
MATVWPVREGDFQPPAAPRSSADSPHASLTLLALAVSLFGFVGVAGLLYAYKFEGVGAYWHGIATRDLFVLALGMAASPLLLCVVRRMPLALLPLPILLIVFLYPLFSPYGIPYSRDPVFNFSFAQAVLTTGRWVPNLDVYGQAVTYSYFPAGAIYNAEFASFTGIPILSAYNWAYPAFRLLVIPTAVYGIGVQLFGPRVAMLGTFLYLAVPSIEFGLPTQQDFGIPFFALVVLGVVTLATAERHRGALFTVTALFAVSVLLSHHVSGYVTGIWLFALTVLPIVFRRKIAYPRALAAPLLIVVFLVWAVYALLVIYPVLVLQAGLLQANLVHVLHPSAAGAQGASGETFPAYQLAWIGLSVFLTVIGAVAAFLDRISDRHDPFPAFALLASLVVGVIALPFVSTGFSFLSLRLMEYIGIVLCPAAAWWLLQGLPPTTYRYAQPFLAHRTMRARTRRVGGIALTVVAASLIFTGGSLIPLTTRDQFATPASTLIDAPRYVDSNALDAALWANAHFDHRRGVWGDELVTTTFAGFGHLKVRWNGYPLFNGSGFNRSALAQVGIGDYVVIDAYMTTAYTPPEFDGPASQQPTSAIPVSSIEKFFNPFYFAEIYQNPVFTIFEVLRLPPAS